MRIHHVIGIPSIEVGKQWLWVKTLFVDFVHVITKVGLKFQAFVMIILHVNIALLIIIILDNFMLVCETVLFCMNVFFLFVLFINDYSLNAI